MFSVRQYKDSDKSEVERWINSYKLPIEIVNYFPKETTFILEINKKPAIVGCAYLSNCGNLSYLDNAFGNPDLKGKDRTEGFKLFVKWLEDFSKELGYKMVMFSTSTEKIADKYKQWGYYPQEMTFFTKILNKGDR